MKKALILIHGPFGKWRYPQYIRKKRASIWCKSNKWIKGLFRECLFQHPIKTISTVKFSSIEQIKSAVKKWLKCMFSRGGANAQDGCLGRSRSRHAADAVDAAEEVKPMPADSDAYMPAYLHVSAVWQRGSLVRDWATSAPQLTSGCEETQIDPGDQGRIVTWLPVGIWNSDRGPEIAQSRAGASACLNTQAVGAARWENAHSAGGSRDTNSRVSKRQLISRRSGFRVHIVKLQLHEWYTKWGRKPRTSIPGMSMEDM